MDVKYQIFISSTFDDLKDERRIVMESILEMGHIPVGMEQFQASNEEQWRHIQRRIKDCDYYIVVVAERYGSEKDGKSYTQLEYEFAVENKIPVAAFILSENASKNWPKEKLETKKAKKLEKFKKICMNKLVKRWSNSHELGLYVTNSLNLMFVNDPRPGWIRANSGVPLEVVEEIAKLSDEKRKLQSELDKVKAEQEVNSGAYQEKIIDRMKNITVSNLIEKSGSAISVYNDMSIIELFVKMITMFRVGCKISSIYFEVRDILQNTFSTEDYIGVESAFCEILIAELIRNNLIGSEYIQESSFNSLRNELIYRITPFGNEVYMRIDMQNDL